MKQVLIHRGKVQIEDVPAPLLDGNHILVEVAHSLISTGTEVSGVKRSGESLAKKTIQKLEDMKEMFHINYSQANEEKADR